MGCDGPLSDHDLGLLRRGEAYALPRPRPLLVRVAFSIAFIEDLPSIDVVTSFIVNERLHILLKTCIYTPEAAHENDVTWFVP